MSSAATRQDRIDAEAAGWLAAIECGTADRQAFEQWRPTIPGMRSPSFVPRRSRAGLDALREAGLSDQVAPQPEEAADESSQQSQAFPEGRHGGAVAAGLAGLGFTYAAAAQEAETAWASGAASWSPTGSRSQLNTDSHVSWRRRDGAYAIDLLRGEVMLERRPGSAPCQPRMRAIEDRSRRRWTDGRTIQASRGRPLGARRGSLPADSRFARGGPRRHAAQGAGRSGSHPSLSAISQLDAAAVSAMAAGSAPVQRRKPCGRASPSITAICRARSRSPDHVDPASYGWAAGSRPPIRPISSGRSTQIYGVSAQLRARSHPPDAGPDSKKFRTSFSGFPGPRIRTVEGSSVHGGPGSAIFRGNTNVRASSRPSGRNHACVLRMLASPAHAAAGAAGAAGGRLQHSRPGPRRRAQRTCAAGRHQHRLQRRSGVGPQEPGAARPATRRPTPHARLVEREPACGDRARQRLRSSWSGPSRSSTRREREEGTGEDYSNDDRRQRLSRGPGDARDVARKADNLVNVLSADDVGKLPDTNIAEGAAPPALGLSRSATRARAAMSRSAAPIRSSTTSR